MSHPSWVCGLKQKVVVVLSKKVLSHPSWVCGLKLNNPIRNTQSVTSHPSWVCGLKLPQWNTRYDSCRVTPFVGVWIETNLVSLYLNSPKSHPSWVCGLKHIHKKVQIQLLLRHTLRGCVD